MGGRVMLSGAVYVIGYTGLSGAALHVGLLAPAWEVRAGASRPPS